ncbi:MAG: D-alanyl-D-alanine carboxypeptidase family protein [Tissierellaceae bacterium]
MKKVIFLIVLLLAVSTYSFAEDLNLTGEGAILIDVDSLEILYEKNPHERLYPASTTKIMTAILAIELSDLDDIVIVDQEVVDLTDGSHIALEPGERLTMEQMLNALLIPSANDAALAIAKHISGSIEGFSKLMNEKAKSLGALNTNFVNPNGLPDENHYTSAYDLALIARYAMENEIFRSIVGNYTYTIPVTNVKTEERYLKSSNKLLYSNEKINLDGNSIPIKFEGVNGVKTGYTIAAGNCLVTSYEDLDNKLISVVLKSDPKDVYSDTHRLLNYGINNFEKARIGFANKFIENFQVENGVQPYVAGITKSDSYYILQKNKNTSIEERIIADSPIAAPIEKNQVIGKMEYWIDDHKVAESHIISTMDIDALEAPSLLKRLVNNWYWFVFLVLILSRVWVISNRRKRRKQRSATLFGA